MSDPHLGFIVAAYAVTFLVVGLTSVAILLRHRALRVALAKLGDSREDERP